MLLENGLNLNRFLQNSSRIVILATLCSFLVLTTTFQTLMILSFAKRPKEHQINTLKEIIELKLKCYTSDEVKTIYKTEKEPFRSYITNCTTMTLTNRERLIQGFAQRKQITMTLRRIEFKHTAFKFFLMGYQEALIHPVPARIKLDPAYIYFVKGHPLYIRYRDIIRRMFTCGLRKYLLSQTDYSIDRLLQAKAVIHPQNLSFEQISVAFYILLAGLGISLGVFLIEFFLIRVFYEILRRIQQKCKQ